MTEMLTGLPTAHPSVVWAPLQLSDAGSLHRLLEQLEEAEGSPYRTSLAEVESMFDRAEHWEAVAGYSSPPNPSAAVTMTAVEAPEMLAFGYVGLTRSGGNEAVCQGGVTPHARGAGLGSKLLEWQTRAGARLLESKTGERAGVLTHTVPDGDEDFQAGLENLGYRWVGSAVELRADLDKWRCGQHRPYLKIVPWSEDMDDAARRAFNRVNAELGGGRQASRSEWQHMNSAMNRAWSHLALSQEGDRPRVVGLVSTGGFEQDWLVLGWKEGVLQIVAVFEPDGRDEILKSLLDSTVQSLMADGLDKMSVTLDPISEKATVDFYQRLGFDMARWFHTYSLPVRTGPRSPLFD